MPMVGMRVMISMTRQKMNEMPEKDMMAGTSWELAGGSEQKRSRCGVVGAS